MRPGTKASLCDLEAAAFAEKEIAGWYADILERDFSVSVRCVVIAEHRQHAQHFDARRIERNEDLRLLFVPGPAGVGLPHHDRDLAARIADAR